MRTIKNLKFEAHKYPEVLRLVNRLAMLEDRKAHDVGKRLLLKHGRERLEQRVLSVSLKK